MWLMACAASTKTRAALCARINSINCLTGCCVPVTLEAKFNATSLVRGLSFCNKALVSISQLSNIGKT